MGALIEYLKEFTEKRERFENKINELLTIKN